MKIARKSSHFTLWALFAVTGFTAEPGHAQNKNEAVDKIFSWVGKSSPGCAVAASQDGKLVINRAYGLADLERDVAITSHSVFDAGSVRKQFIAAAILLLVEEGELSLTDDVRTHIPQLPDYGHKITVDHLLTHTSGIRDWQPLLNAAGGDPDAMTMILRQRELNFVPGDEWSYSNSGYVLLPEIHARVSGMPFAEFARKRLFEPLGMKSTRWVDDPLIVVKNRALAYSKENGSWKMDMYLGNDRGGAGALFTTAVDLVAWNDALTDKRLGTFVSEKLEEPATLNNGRKLIYARALFVDVRSGDRLVWHSGGAAGYSTKAVRLPERKLSLAIMCNLDGGAREEYANSIFDLFLPPADPVPNTSAAGVDVPLGELSTRAGLFFDEKTGQPLRLVVNNNALAIAGGGPLVALAPDRFRNQRKSLYLLSQAEFDLQFLSPDQIEIKTTDGITTRYRRAKADPATAADLKAFGGRYKSDELMAVFEITAGKDSLLGRANERPGPPFEFKPVDRDTFQFAALILRFKRDQGGKVVGLEYSSPMLRNVKFARASEG